MNHYTITAELTTRSAELDGQRLDHLLTELEPWHAAVGTSPYGYAEIRMSIAADDLLQALATARATLATTGEQMLRVDVIDEALGDAREGDDQIPALVDPPEAAEIIGVSRPTVLAMIERGELSHARVGQRGTVIARASAEKVRLARRG